MCNAVYSFHVHDFIIDDFEWSFNVHFPTIVHMDTNQQIFQLELRCGITPATLILH